MHGTAVRKKKLLPPSSSTTTAIQITKKTPKVSNDRRISYYYLSLIQGYVVEGTALNNVRINQQAS
jgi:hypothetical protein